MVMTDVPTKKKKLADIVAIYGRGRELFGPPTYTASLLNTPKFSTICLSEHCTITFVTLTFWFLHTKHLEKEMMKTNSKISQFELFVVNDASLMLYLKYVCFIQELNLSHWSCCG